MNTEAPQSSLRAATRRIEEGLEARRVGQGPDAARRILDWYCSDGRRYINRARRNQSGGELKDCAQSKASLDSWDDLIRHDASMGNVTFLVSCAMDARNRAAHLDRWEPASWSVRLESRLRTSGGLSVLRVNRRDA